MSFAPIYSDNSQILILGSYPSPKSREVQFYYGNEQNRFWKMLSNIYNVNLPNDINGKKSLILNNSLALWDSLYSCDINGASDASITNPVANDIKALCSNANIKRILCNGATAYKMYIKFNNIHNIQCMQLPSTSPANAAYSLDKLVSLWKPQLLL
ncbi:MAG: DNA-deoxyinosine glycosylase [Oscillospiraceae bacterium]